MADEDDSVYRRRLSDVLREHGFGWVVEQAEAQIAGGKPSFKEVSEQQYLPPRLDSEFIVRPPRRRRASLITTEPYSEGEQLDILLHAIGAAIVQREELEETILNQLDEINAIDFEPETAPAVEGVSQSHRLDRRVVEHNRQLRERTTEHQMQPRLIVLLDLRISI
jgi:hypothetical protein